MGCHKLGIVALFKCGIQHGRVPGRYEFPDKSTTVSYSGEGGLHQLYLGAGFKKLKIFLSVQFFVSLGRYNKNRCGTFPSSSSVFPITIQSNVAVKSYKLDFGAQYTHQFGKKHVATLGVVFSPGHDLSNDAYEVTQTGNSNTGATSVTRDTVVTCGIPTTFGAGVTYVYDNRLTVGRGCNVPELEQSELYEQ